MRTKGEEDVGFTVEMAPETSHPVAINTFDKLTQLHMQIHHQLVLQERLIQSLLTDGDVDVSRNDLKDSL